MNAKPDLTPLKRGDADIERLAEVTLEDIEAARVAWRKYAPPQYRNLLDAKEDDDERE
jgi:hypothetical protein